MPLWKQTLLSIYFRTTRPYRHLRARQAARTGSVPLAVIAFHRIADDAANDWTTSTRTFVRAVDWLERNFELISLAEVQRRMRAGCSRHPAVSITFDDGYAVNCEHALPLLVRRRIPCTYFVTSQAVLTGAPFEHDTRMGNHFAPNTPDQLKRFADDGIEIGAHSRTHADLAAITDPEILFDEMITATDDLERALGRRTPYFAFPFGKHRHLTREAFDLARGYGFDGVCSAYGGYNVPGDDAFHLQRRCVDGALVRLKNWTTVDPWRHWHIARFDSSANAAEPAAAGLHS